MRFCEVNESLEYRNCVGESYLDVEVLVKYFGGGTLVKSVQKLENSLRSCVGPEIPKMASAESTGVQQVQKLSGSDDYFNWKFDMEMVLIGRDLWDIVTGAEVLPENPTEKARNDFRRRDNKARSIICLSITSDLKIYIRNCKSSKEAWDSLQGHFEEKTMSKILMYRKQMYKLQLEKGGNMTDHINKLKVIAEHRQAVDDAPLEKDLVYTLLNSLSEEYNHLITTLETLPKEKLTWDYVRDRLLAEFERNKGEQEKKDEKGSGNPHDALFCGGNGYKKFNKSTSLKTRTIRATQIKLHLNLIVTIAMKLGIR